MRRLILITVTLLILFSITIENQISALPDKDFRSRSKSTQHPQLQLRE